MADQPAPFESKIDAALRRLDEVDRRLQALEARVASGSWTTAPTAAPAEAASPRLGASGVSPLTMASLTGRTSLVLSGGYVLRALADAGLAPLPLAIALGLIYAALWLAMVDRAGASRKAASAIFHAVAGCALAFPLLFEVIVKFQLHQPWVVAGGLLAISALGVLVGWRQRLESVVWIVSVAAIVTAVALLRVGQEIAPFALDLALLATLTYWAAEAGNWWAVRWPSAMAADGAAIWLALSTVPPQDADRPALAITVGLTLFVTTFASIAVRLLALGRRVIRFEMFQAAATLLVGYGGAAYILRGFGMSVLALGTAGLLLGSCLYLVSFRRTGAALLSGNFYYFSTLAVALTILGGSLAFSAPIPATMWMVLAVGATWLGRRFSNVTVSSHGAAYLVAAAVASGLLTVATAGLLGPPRLTWHEVTPVALVALLAAALCSAVSPLGVRPFKATTVMAIAARRTWVGVPRAVALGILIVGLAGIAALAIVSAAAALPASPEDWGMVATIRTAALAAAVLLMALIARGERVREAGWMIYPLLVVAGLKILLEDFRHSEPAALSLALIAYGGALIAGPRLASK
jgi:hypothetical protein